MIRRHIMNVGISSTIVTMFAVASVHGAEDAAKPATAPAVEQTTTPETMKKTDEDKAVESKQGMEQKADCPFHNKVIESGE